MPGTIIKRGKSWVVVVDLGRGEQGQRLRKWRSFETKREAEYHQAQQATHPAVGAGVGVYGNPRLRLGPYLEQWLEEHAKARVRPSTFKRYQQLVRVHLIPGLGHLPLARLSPKPIETFYRALAGKVSGTTAHHIAGVLHESLKQAVRWYLIGRNPAELVEKPRRARHAPDLWSFEQAARFLEGARDTRYYLLYALLMGTGLRLGEALTLRWQDIDINAGVLVVREGKTPQARRAVLLPAELVRELRAARGLGLVFSRNGKALNAWTIRRCHFYPLVKRLGLPRVRLHDLRHLHASVLLEQGADLAAVSARLGHASKGFTLAVYGHVLTAGQEKAAAAANLLLTRAGAVR